MNFSNSRRLKVNPSWLPQFLAKVQVGEPDECWYWAAGVDAQGYGSFWVPERGRAVGAHVVAYYLTTGEWPNDGEQVCHHCDVRACVNPGCMFLGSQQDNLADMRAKGRGSLPPVHRGEAHHSATLSDAQVAEMRASYTGQRGQKALLAVRYGISKTAVTKILSGSVR